MYLVKQLRQIIKLGTSVAWQLVDLMAKVLFASLGALAQVLTVAADG